MNSVITAEDIESVDTIRLELINCRNKQDIDSVVRRAGITSHAVMTEFLQMAMSIEKVYGITDGTVPNEEDDYNYYVDFYLGGFWKGFA
jgi:hypothetical protein